MAQAIGGWDFGKFVVNRQIHQNFPLPLLKFMVNFIKAYTCG